MDKELNENQNGFNPYMNGGIGFDMNDIYKDPMFNPVAQYEQAYSYKEYEKMCKN